MLKRVFCFQVYYDVSTSITPYAQCLFAKRPPSAEKRNDSANTKEEGHGYIDMRGAGKSNDQGG